MNSVKKARSLWNVVKFKGGRCAPLVAAILIVALFASSCLIGNALAQAVVPPHYHDDRYYTKSYVNMFFHLNLSKPLNYVWANASILPCNDTITLGNATYPWSEIYSVILYSSRIFASNMPPGSPADHFVTWNPTTGELRYITSAPSDSDWSVNPTNPAGPAIYNLTHYVGIGTDQPGAKLHVEGGEIWLFWSGQNPRFVIGDSPTTGEYGWLQWDSANNYLRLDTSNAPAVGLKIKDNYVSIGNVYPDAPLKVASDTNLLLKVDTTAIEAYTHLLPSTAGNYDLGSSSNYWRALYTGNASLKHLLPLTGSDILVKGNITPVSDNTYWLGNNTHAWARLYAHGVNTDDIYPIIGSSIYVHGNLNPDDGAYDLGYYSKRWRNLYIKEYSGGQGFIQMGSSTNYGRFYFYPSDSMFVFTKGIRTYPSGAANLGSSTYHWGTLHVDQIYAYNLPSGATTDYVVTIEPTSKEFRMLPISSISAKDKDWLENPTIPAIYNLTHNVGIGTDTPTAKLEVVGDIKAEDVLPRSDSSYSLGTSSLKWQEAHCNILYAHSSCRIGSTGQVQLSYITSPITALRVNEDILPSSDDAYWLGHPSRAWARLYAYGVNTDDLYPITGSAIYVHGHLNPDDGSYDLGYYNKRWRNLYIKEYSDGQGFIQMGSSSNYGRIYFYPSDSMFVFTKGIRTYPSGAANLGSSTYHWGTLHVDQIYAYNLPPGNIFTDALVVVSPGGELRKIGLFTFKDKDWNITSTAIYNLTGNVGIGTANPTAKLEVAGTSKMQDILPRGTSYNLGSASNYWRSTYARDLISQRILPLDEREPIELYGTYWFNPKAEKDKWLRVVSNPEPDPKLLSGLEFIHPDEERLPIRIGIVSPEREVTALWIYGWNGREPATLATFNYTRGEPIVRLASVIPTTEKCFLGAERNPWAELWTRYGYITDRLTLMNVPKDNSLDKVLVIDDRGNVKWRDASTLAGKDSDWAISGEYLYNLTGKVGIGTSSPREKLEVAGNIMASAIIDREDQHYFLDLNDASNLYDLSVYNSLGVGTSPPAGVKLEVAGTAEMENVLPRTDNTYNLGSSGQKWKQLHVSAIYAYNLPEGSTSDYTVTWDPSTKQLRYVRTPPGADRDWEITPTTIYNTWAKVGIGTDSPREKLDVAGNIRVNNIYPRSNNDYNLGTSTYRWHALYVYDIYPYGRIYGPLLPGSSGTYDLGSSTYKWRHLYLSGRVYSSLIPGSNNLYNLGSTSYKWKSLYVYNIYPYGRIYGHLLPGYNGYYDLGSSTYKWRNLFFSGKVYNNLIPGSDNTYNLGSSSYRWKRLYLSGYMRIGTSTNYGQLSYSTSDKSFVFSKSMRPSSTNSLDLGTSSYRWRNLYTYTIYLGSGSYPRLAAGSYTSLKIRTSHGYLEAGPRNTDWCHFVTDRPSFWFNKKVTVAGNVEPYKGNTYSRHLGSSTSRWANLYLKGTIYLYHGSTSKYARMQYIDPYIVFSKGLRPTSRYGANLGTSYYRWNTVYCKTVNTGDLILSNGNVTWILFEGTDGLYIYNPDTGKQYKLLMEEVPATYTARGG